MSHQMLENGLKKEMNNFDKQVFNYDNRLQKAVTSYFDLNFILFDKFYYLIRNNSTEKQ